MIVYDLACAQGHRFEGWFDSGEAFERQQQGHLVRCPVCDGSEIARLPSARVSVGKHAKVEASASTPKATEGGGDVVAGLPAGVISRLREIVRNTENVGRRFPEEARRIHYEEVPPRAIRGQASPDEAQELREEGIDFAALPPLLTSESH